MKSFASVPDDMFYNPAASFAAGWYDRSRTTIRRKANVLRTYTVEQDGRKAEVVCSVILTVSLLVAFADCVVQFALS